ncbi:MAG: rhomboid family intramembrane serine protease [Acidobacteria bacterium]|nr:rhomboid family intramembrane serine protease [Acidobacteriota bacterium]
MPEAVRHPEHGVMIIPYHVDVPMARVPFANFGLIAITCLCFLLFTISGYDLTEKDVADPWLVGGGHMLLHGNLVHLLGNMIFLWVFGNAVCAKVGNFVYPVVYFGLGFVAMAVHLAIDGRPGIGASGAINGIVGMFVVWYALNEISCFCFFFYYTGTFSLSSFWMILMWFLFDIWGALRGPGPVAYFAHLGGFAAGVLLACLLLATGLVRMAPGERSLLAILTNRDDNPPEKRRRPHSAAPKRR